MLIILVFIGMMITEIRKWINLVEELNQEQIMYYGHVSPEVSKWLVRKGRNSYSGGKLRPIIINGKMVGGISWNLGGIDYIELKPEYQSKGLLRKIIYDNAEDGVVKFVTASDGLSEKMHFYSGLF